MTPFSSWTDVNGRKNRYWHGNQNSTDEGCKCSDENSCDSGFSAARNINYKCNCDSYLPDAHDYGILESTSKLPIMKLHYGGSITPFSEIVFKLEPMVCSGKKTYYPSELALEDRNHIKKRVSTFETKLEQTKIKAETIINSTLNRIESQNVIFKESIYSTLQDEIVHINTTIRTLRAEIEESSTIAFRAAPHSTTGNPSMLENA